jgi:hypothetical protein
MNTNRSLRLVKFAVLAMLTACFGANLAHAQTLQGKFNLPFEVQWGHAVLPPGNYSFTVDPPDAPSNAVLVRGENHTTTIIVSRIDNYSFSGKSALVVERYGDRGMVRELRLAKAGLVFSYPALKAERQVLAQGPVLIQRLPILMANK